MNSGNESDKSLNFSCRHCGHHYKLYPPDSSLKYAYLVPCNKHSERTSHNFKMKYLCEHCNQYNELYWCQGHPAFASSKRITDNRSFYRDHSEFF